MHAHTHTHKLAGTRTHIKPSTTHRPHISLQPGYLKAHRCTKSLSAPTENKRERRERKREGRVSKGERFLTAHLQALSPGRHSRVLVPPNAGRERQLRGTHRSKHGLASASPPQNTRQKGGKSSKTADCLSPTRNNVVLILRHRFPL